MGFEWVEPLGSTGMHLLFFIIILSALFIALGFFYRVSAIIFFAGFTYVELIDVTTYLNHYYFISLVAFIMIWLPANRHYSLDVAFNRVEERELLPLWMHWHPPVPNGGGVYFCGYCKTKCRLADRGPANAYLAAGKITFTDCWPIYVRNLGGLFVFLVWRCI